jgi:hypothetical protein
LVNSNAAKKLRKDEKGKLANIPFKFGNVQIRVSKKKDLTLVEDQRKYRSPKRQTALEIMVV